MCRILNNPMEVKKYGSEAAYAISEPTWPLVKRICEKAYVEAHQSVLFVSTGQRIKSFHASFLDSSECGNHCGEEDFEKKDCDGREKEKKLKENLESNVTFCVRNSLCRNRETTVDPIPRYEQIVEG